MRRTLLLSIVAGAAAALTPMRCYSQMAKEKPARDISEPTYKYEAFAGFGYTSLNQVSQSNSGLSGVSVSITRDWGRFFGVTLEGGHYQWTLTRANPERTSVNQYLAGPVIHAPLYENVGIFVHALLGAIHTGGVPIRPDYSFAGGFGMGIDYKISPHLGVRAYGDDIGSSFTVTPYQTGDSPHRRFNAHAAVGVTYKF